MFRKAITFLKLPFSVKFITLMVFLLYALRKILLIFKSKYAYSEFLIKKLINKYSSNSDISEKDKIKINQIRKAVKLISKNVTLKNVCRDQAWCATILLTFYKIPYKYVVGIKKDKNSQEERGHCWVLVDEKFVSGYCKQEEYIVIKSIKS